MKRTYFFNLLKMKMLSIRLIISVFCMVFMNFLVVMPDIRANYDKLDIVYLFRFTYDIGSFSRLLPLLAAFVMADAVAQDFCNHTMPFLLARMDDKTYINCNYIVCAVSGFFTITAGWVVFVLLLQIRYPFLAVGSDNLENFVLQPFGQWLQNENPCVYIAFYIFSSALCGSLWACVGLAVSAFYPDRKVALASPFIINILLYNIAYISTGPWHSPSDVAKYISQANDTMTFLSMAGYFILLHVVVHRIFHFKMRWRFIHA